MASNSIDYSATLSSLRSQQAQHPLSILALAESITASQAQAQAQSQSDLNLLTSNAQPQPRPSDASSSHNASDLDGGGSGQLTPSSLSADLAHYKDLFAKLRFSYLEQVTKEKYLRSIVGDPPLVVTHDDNLELEAKLAVMKQELKAKKEGVEVLVRDMEAQAQDLAGVYEDVQRGMGVLESVPVEIERLREQVEALRKEVAEKRAGTTTTEEQRRERDDPRMNMSLEATRQALAEQTSHTKEIEGQIAALQRELPGKMERMEAVDRELAELDRRRNESARLAGEERKRKEMGGRDEVEELARWYRSKEVVYRGLGLGVEG
ncbi:hypothetical protein LTR67_005743 [Exophiala xenobiotica]